MTIYNDQGVITTIEVDTLKWSLSGSDEDLFKRRKSSQRDADLSGFGVEDVAPTSARWTATEVVRRSTVELSIPRRHLTFEDPRPTPAATTCLRCYG